MAFGPERPALKALAAELSITNQVRFLGYQPEPRPPMREHRVYCHTSTMESFGIVLVEAMAEGLPVIAAPVGGVPEVFRPGTEGEFWPLDDVAAAAEVLIDLMEDPAGRARMSAAAQARFRTEFSAEVVGRRLLNFLQETTIRPQKSLV